MLQEKGTGHAPRIVMWKCAKAWGYVNHNPFDGLVLPKITHQRRFFFAIEEIQRIIIISRKSDSTLMIASEE